MVSLAFSTVEVVITLWYLLLPRRPLYMALLQLVVAMVIKYAFIGDDGIASFIQQFDFTPSGLTNDMSQDKQDTIWDTVIIFSILILGIMQCYCYLCSSKKTETMKTKDAKVVEDYKEKKS